MNATNSEIIHLFCKPNTRVEDISKHSPDLNHSDFLLFTIRFKLEMNYICNDWVTHNFIKLQQLHFLQYGGFLHSDMLFVSQLEFVNYSLIKCLTELEQLPVIWIQFLFPSLQHGLSCYLLTVTEIWNLNFSVGKHKTENRMFERKAKRIYQCLVKTYSLFIFFEVMEWKQPVTERE